MANITWQQENLWSFDKARTFAVEKSQKNMQNIHWIVHRN